MSEKVKVWISRDGNKDSEYGGELYLYSRKPIWDDSHKCWFGGVDYVLDLEDELFPEIKNGECYSAEIVLGEKV